jgi:hypothetical protein
MTTLRDIITADVGVLWRDNVGAVWDSANILEQWGADLDREAYCTGGVVQYIDEDGYITGAGAVLSEIDNKHLTLPVPERG